MRQEPNWRIPVGIFALLIGLLVYGIVIARYVPELVVGWPVILQMVVYLVLGLIWLLPLRRFLIWMETGRWGAPADDGADA
ncbi:DUF2842 domain-containing protein [Alteriqipengyuania lutimaris]|uniref:DUF2842 domain-containing protein n=1 Tax=Alteriqipengyuania lutimaris TaxID=1538146 RepID=A0A395LTM8_9SPHN|nr:DUF2842 domain-containing protein [Alteriqipengyuania lutimaris]MBB3033060.1 putative membrane protein [Alteriqipengyuania lutimaris]RDS77870.1 DUF2842 domain-containing protein [Alteriqipengyuania lutimaris]